MALTRVGGRREGLLGTWRARSAQKILAVAVLQAWWHLWPLLPALSLCLHGPLPAPGSRARPMGRRLPSS